MDIEIIECECLALVLGQVYWGFCQSTTSNNPQQLKFLRLKARLSLEVLANDGRTSNSG